jgi:hypothetical protein
MMVLDPFHQPLLIYVFRKESISSMRKTPSDSDLDADLASAVAPEYNDDFAPAGSSVNRDMFTQSRNGVSGFSVVPLWVLKEMTRARAHHAIALVGVLLHRMRMQGTDTVPITAAIWAKIGMTGKWERQIALQHLRLVPGVLRLEERHKRLTRYQVTLGEMWGDQ